jgi:PAS domain S-box-containing protein
MAKPTHAAVIAPLAEREDVRGLRATIDLAPIGIAHFAPDGRFLLVNAQLCEMLGCASEELLRKTFQEITFPDDLDACVALNREIADGKRASYGLEKRFVRGDGSFVWARVNVSAARDAQGDIAFFIGVAADTTEQHAADAARRESEQQFRTLANAISQMAWISDAQGRRTWFNDRWYEYTGFSFPEVAGFGWHRVHHPAYVADVLERQQESLARGDPWEDTFPLRGRDGSFRWFLTRAVPLRDASGTIVQWFGTNTDITERRTAEVERERILELERVARDKAERASLTRDEMVAIVAHDLRNPVHTIAMAAATLQMPVAPEQASRLTKMIQRTAGGMETLLNDLLDISRIEARTFAVARSPVDVHALLADAREAFESHAAQRHVILEAFPPPAPLCVMGDPARLGQVLSNLLGNALKHAPADSRIALEARVADKWVEFRVQDHGRGVPADHLLHIFDRFWQADRTARTGAGLGLPIAKGIVEAHGGRIWAQSAPGQGMTVRFTLPLGLE